MIELRGLVAAPGLAPVTASVRIGEVVRIDGTPAAARALLEVLAGRRAALAGELSWHDPGGRAVLIRAGERLPPGIEPAAPLALWRALAGAEAAPASRPAGTGRAGAAAGRGFGVAPAIWLIDGAPEVGAEAVVAAADDDVRGGAGALLWSAAAGRGPADRVITVEAASGATGAAPGSSGSAPAPLRSPSSAAARAARAAAARRWHAMLRFAAAAATARGAVALAMIAALWLALVAAVVATHEGFWYGEGRRDGLLWIVRLAALGAAAVASLAAATRAARARAWPAMLRETRATRPVRALALTLGDAAGALPTAVVAAWPASWLAVALDGGAGASRIWVVAGAVVAGAVAAGAVTRGARSIAAAGALVGLGLATALMW